MPLTIIYTIHFITLTTSNQCSNKALLYNKIINLAQTSKFNIKNHMEIIRNILHYLFTYFILNKGELSR
ncbi:hypothetical protein FPI77_20750 [Klebsiella quasivariicola]|nr:hypothetical protein B8P98_10160 [Klebsiella quasivariicola]MBK2371662.1 hypothetical protein [Klebsiella quasivariicola]QBL48793.1 hypothetical protein BMD99_009690 [Klebsiella sp. PO552]TTM69028.1 hypothetical protein FPI77_20750 [Klebsiella quasivariicola]